MILALRVTLQLVAIEIHVSQIAGAVAPVVTGWSLGPQKDFRFAIFVAGTCPIIAAVCLIVAGASLPKLVETLERRSHAIS